MYLSFEKTLSGLKLSNESYNCTVTKLGENRNGVEKEEGEQFSIAHIMGLKDRLSPPKNVTIRRENA